MDDENAKRGFKVEDRRRFSASGDPRDEAQAEAAAPPPPAAPAASAPREQAGPLPEMTFSTFVIGLITQALILLGEVPDPSSPGAAADLVAAKQMIDILGILQAKTKGNLEAAEAGLLDNALYDLRMKYVQQSRSK